MPRGVYKNGSNSERLKELHRLKNFGFQKGNRIRLGIKHTEKTKQKMKEKKKNISEGTREKLSKAHLNMKKPWVAIRVSKTNKKRVGKNHPRWVNGNYKKRQERNDSAYQNWVRQCKKRDNYKCRIRNEDCKGYLEVHHILSWRDFPELRYEIKNGVTLCQFHHPRKWIDEQRLIPSFQEMVESKEHF